MSHSLNDILSFLDTMGKQAYMPLNSVNSKKASVIKVLNTLDENERNNLDENLNIDSLVHRFKIKSKHDLNSKSLTTYASRFENTFKEFLQWNKNPSDFKPKTGRGRPMKTNKKLDKASKVKQITTRSTNETVPVNANTLVKYPILTDTIRGSLELPETLSDTSAEQIIPYITQIVRLHCNNNSQADADKKN